tara:strand:+ start:5769 stop:9860 length:4092 start_codon:yes stop_codon:yes gene_type:complete
VSGQDLDALSPEQKRTMLLRLLREKQQRIQPFCVSFSQRRLWFLDRMEPGSIGYIMPVALQLTGKFDLAAFQQGLGKVVERHGVLRTTLSDSGGELQQFLHSSMKIVPVIHDLRNSPLDKQEKLKTKIIQDEIKCPFDLEKGPLCRVTVLRLADDKNILLINLHHIITDGWSTGILANELVTFYQAELVGKTISLPPLPIQYTDYARWQQSWMKTKSSQREIDYWRKHLVSPLPRLELATDYPRPSSIDYRGGKYELTLNSTLVGALTTIGRHQEATMFMVLLTAFKILLYRYTGQEDIVLGTVVSGRQRAETESLIGLFVNTLVLRTKLCEHPTFIEALERVKEVSLGAMANQAIPFEKLVEDLNPERHPGKTPLFEIMFNFGNMPRATAEFGGIVPSFVELGGVQAKHAITLYADEARGDIKLSLVYQRALFNPERMHIMLQQLVYLLEQIALNPNNVITRYSLSTPETVNMLPDVRQKLPTLFYEPVTESFRRWVTRTPDNVAVSQTGRHLTYRQLQYLANTISDRLIACKFQPGDTVALIGPRSFGLISSIIAILQSRGVLLQIDHTYPEYRCKQLLTEGKARYVVQIIQDEDEGPDGADFFGLPVIRISANAEDVNRLLSDSVEQIQPSEFCSEQDDPAYICFTSGSTGTPKGVLCNHKGLSHFISWQREKFEVSQVDNVAQLSRPSFDVAMRDIFLPLSSGARLCLPPDQSKFETSEILAWLESESISIAHIVPAIAQASLINVTPSIKLKRLRWLLFAGEPLTDHLVNQWRNCFPQSGELANLYGPTETTLAKFCYHVPYPATPGVQPVGRALPQTQGLVLNEHGQICGIGELGEIVIRTPYQSLGYINVAVEEGNKKQDGFRHLNDDPSNRCYYTGDFGKYRVDGLLDIVGRIDQQVKLGGVRIELGEIQSVICKHPGIRECLVRIMTTDNDQRLVAYTVQEPGTSPIPVSSLRAKIRRELPKHMHPSFYICLEAFPLLPNGKIDQQALPLPGPERPELRDPYLAPRTETERNLCELWEQLLQVTPIGIHDDFFELGGHSLLAARLMAHISKAFNHSLPLASLFVDSTVEKLAKRLERSCERSYQPIVPIQPKGNNTPLFFVHPAGGNVLCYSALADLLGEEQPFYGLQSNVSGVNCQAPEKLEDMASRYIEAITRVQPSGPYFLGGWSMGAIVAYEMARQLALQNQQIAMLVLLDNRPSDYYTPDQVSDELSVMKQYFDGALDFDDTSLDDMTSQQRLDYFLSHAKTLGLLPPEVDKTQVRYYLQVYLANIRSVQNYSTQPYPHSVTLVRTKSATDGQDKTLGWDKFVEGGVEVFEIPGKHHELVFEPFVSDVADVLKQCLLRARSSDSKKVDT